MLVLYRSRFITSDKKHSTRYACVSCHCSFTALSSRVLSQLPQSFPLWGNHQHHGPILRTCDNEDVCSTSTPGVKKVNLLHNCRSPDVMGQDCPVLLPRHSAPHAAGCAPRAAVLSPTGSPETGTVWHGSGCTGTSPGRYLIWATVFNNHHWTSSPWICLIYFELIYSFVLCNILCNKFCALSMCSEIKYQLFFVSNFPHLVNTP